MPELWEINLNQNFPLSKGYEGGSSNQNYSIIFNYGWNDNLTLGGFFSHSDDPLTKEIKNVNFQPANKWISFGISYRWQFLKKDKVSISFDLDQEPVISLPLWSAFLVWKSTFCLAHSSA